MKRLLAIIGDGGNAVEYVRFRQPFSFLRSFGYELVTLGERLTLEREPQGYQPSDALFAGIDAVIFPQLVASPQLADGSRVDLVGAVCRRATELGLPIIYSVDDWPAAVEEHNPAFETTQLSLQNLETILTHAAAIFVTTPALMERVTPYGLPVYLLPNAVDSTRWTPRPRTAHTPRIGWAGSASHLMDLQMVLPAIRRVQEKIDFEFIVFGIVDRPIDIEAEQVRGLLPRLAGSQRRRAERFLELDAALKTVRHAHLPFVAVDDYFDALSNYDFEIGICPLLDSEFNRHKSALKFYEYAMCDTLTVASDVEPYRGEVSITVPNSVSDWAYMLEALLADRLARRRQLNAQREYVHENRTIQTVCHDWAAALDATLGAQPGELVTSAAETARGKR